MKNIIFLFTKTDFNTPQIDWFNENIFCEDTRIILIFILTENFYYLSDNKLLNFSFQINASESEKRKFEIKTFLEKVADKFKNKEFLSKIILCGEQKEKLSFIIKKIGASTIVIGPDLSNKRAFSIFQSLEDYLCKNVEAAVIRVDK
ncbi:hypothetical protein TUBRATIS_16730 [Tubulinosema ratisbonensis]|uniref:UspA domain-containing protein n=1 Tax=Tubulinosema ratisbonensis TaxID=291195 RepID=A0A437AKY4_9MICR|nr:hypothetical protein TUBRATIS_16730 [Tubulinosema ratisbonensis]